MDDTFNNNGIYLITNIVNGKIYVGSAYRKNGIKGRWSHHKHMLNNNKHCNNHLQLSWNKYGSNSFKIEILEIVNDSVIILSREQFYLDELRPYNPKIGYNILKNAHNSLGYKHTKETKEFLSKNRIGIPLSNQHKINIGKGGLGRINSIETKNKMSKWQIGLTKTQETKDKISKTLIGKFVGEKSGSAKLSDYEANEIRKIYNETKITRKKLSETYSVCKSTIDYILANRRYNNNNNINK